VAVLALELNDAGLLSSTGQDWRDEGPGYALLDPDRLLLGTEARAQARLRPRRLNHQFWARLDTAPLMQPTALAASHADLACAQLDAIWRRRPAGADALLLVAPAFLDRDALGLVLGIAAELGIPVTGLVDAAVAASTQRAPGRELAHLDLGLHGALLTRIEQSDALQRGEFEVLPAAGLLVLEDAWARVAAGAFVAQTRFDPLHAAESEQALYDKLPGWLAALLEADETLAELALNGRPLAVTLARGPIVAAAAGAYRAIAERLDHWRRPGMRWLLQVSHRAAGLPGLARFLSEQPGVELLRLGPDAALAGALARRDDLPAENEGVRFVTRLRALGTLLPARRDAADDAADGVPGAVLPTHVLYEGEALPIGVAGLAIGTAPPRDQPVLVIPGSPAGISRQHCVVRREDGRVVVEDLSRFGSFVNDQRVDGRRLLAPGDRLRLGSPGVVLQLIRVRTDST
jgi:hypothetical protein